MSLGKFGPQQDYQVFKRRAYIFVLFDNLTMVSVSPIGFEEVVMNKDNDALVMIFRVLIDLRFHLCKVKTVSTHELEAIIDLDRVSNDSVPRDDRAIPGYLTQHLLLLHYFLSSCLPVHIGYRVTVISETLVGIVPSLFQPCCVRKLLKLELRNKSNVKFCFQLLKEVTVSTLKQNALFLLLVKKKLYFIHILYIYLYTLKHIKITKLKERLLINVFKFNIKF